MFTYNKKLQYPVKIARPNPRLAAIIISQYGGPDGELGASLRYLSQRYSMPFDELKGLLTDIGTEELGHLEMIGAIVHQLTRNMKDEQYRDPAFAPYFVDHTAGVYPTAASGFPWSAASMQVKGDPIADLAEDMGADATTLHSQHFKNSSRFQPEFASFLDCGGRLRCGLSGYQRSRGSGVSGWYTAVSILCGYPLL